MGQISSNIGLVTGLNIKSTVDQLIALQGITRDALAARGKTYNEQKSALSQLTALAIGVQLTTTQFGNASLFAQRNVASSNEASLLATVSGQPVGGQYQFTPLQLAQSHQLQSSRFASKTTALGAGTFNFQFGGFADRGLDLDLINAGEGFTAGKIRITDRSGAATDVDLSAARNIDDVVRLISDNKQIRVTAIARGDKLRLQDDTGSVTSNLKVEEVDGGVTAASLGLGAINAAATFAEGGDIVKLFGDLALNRLNDGNGIRFDNALGDLKVTFRDGTETNIDFHKIAVLGTKARATTTAANGVNAQLTVTAVTAGSAYAGVNVQFIDDAGLTRGNETVSYDEQNKLLTFRIDAGHTTAHDAVLALGKNSTVSALFTATSPSGSDGTGLVDLGDAALTAGPAATATTPGTLSGNALALFTAQQPGASLDGVTIQFVDNVGVTAGNETVVYDDSNPSDKKLIFQIDAGNSTALNIIDALNNDSTASQYFKAANVNGSDGTGLISVSDTAVTSGGAIVEPVPAGDEATIQDLLDTLNAAAPTKLLASLDASGDHIVLTDLTTDTGGTFVVTDLFGSRVKEDLGLITAGSGATITGRRIFSGLKTSLVRSLNGGQDATPLGLLNLTDRSGASASVNLSTAETLDDVLTVINAAGLGLNAGYNTARNGLLLTDTTGLTASNLIAANGDAANTATRLGLVVNAAVTSKDSGDLHRQSVSVNTLLKEYNGGGGVSTGSFRITDTLGGSATINLTSATQTIGDVIDAINHAGLAVQAEINDNGDGIRLKDTGSGGAELKVLEGASSSAADLRLLGAVQTVSISGTPTKVIDGATTLAVTLTATDTLQTLVDKINALNAGVRAGIFSDGSSTKPFRFTLTSLRSGRAGELQVDTSGVNFTLDQLTRAQDALLIVGDAANGVIATSATNTFNEAVTGLSLTLKSTSATPITLSVSTTHDGLKASLKGFVEAYNRLKTKISDVTKFNADTNTSAILQGDGTVLRLQNDLANLISGRVFGAGSIQSLESLGISLGEGGLLSLNESKLQTAIDNGPDAVQTFLTKSTTGLSARFKKILDQSTAAGSSLLVTRIQSLDRKIIDTGNRVTTWNARLETLRLRLTKQYQDSEVAIQKIQSNLSAINAVAQAAAFYTNNNNK